MSYDMIQPISVFFPFILLDIQSSWNLIIQLFTLNHILNNSDTTEVIEYLNRKDAFIWWDLQNKTKRQPKGHLKVLRTI